MVHYIDKDALVAEIEKLVKDAELYLKYNSDDDSLYEMYKHQKAMMLDLLNKVNTLEVKEVELEKKATQLSQKYFPDEENIWARPNIEAQRCKSACIEMVEWFKAQKGEEV